MTSKELRNKGFRIRLTEKEMNELKWCARETGIAKSSLIRNLISNYSRYLKESKGVRNED